MKKLNERPPVSAREAVPPPPAPSGGMRLADFAEDAGRREHIDDALASAVAQRSAPPAIEPTSAPEPPIQPKPAMRPTKMIATPIDSTLRKTIRSLRNEHDVSEAFTIETALREYFSDRPLEEIAADLRHRGGRLRRTR